jgi:carboxylesterase type B
MKSPLKMTPTVAFCMILFPGMSQEPASSATMRQRVCILSLQWVQKYISEFGGDPAKVILSLSLHRQQH